MLRTFLPETSAAGSSLASTTAGSATSGAGSGSGSGAGGGGVCETGGATRGLMNGLIPTLSEVFLTFLTGSSRSTVGPWTFGSGAGVADGAGVSAAEREVRVEREEPAARFVAVGFSSVDVFLVFSAMVSCEPGERFHTPQAAGVFCVACAAARMRCPVSISEPRASAMSSAPAN